MAIPFSASVSLSILYGRCGDGDLVVLLLLVTFEDWADFGDRVAVLAFDDGASGRGLEVLIWIKA